MNIEAAELVGGLHGQLEKAGFTGIDLEKFLVRIVFCLFADDTCVSGMGNLFSIGWSNEHQKMRMTLGLNYLDLSKHLTHQKKSGGALLDESLSDFVYVNGDLFDGEGAFLLSIPRCGSL